VHDGGAGALMKGKVSSSAILKALLDKRFDLRGSGLISHIILLENPNYHKFFLISDAGFVIAPTLSDKVGIVKNAVGAMHKLGVHRPKVAMIAAVEVVNYEHMPATVDAAIISQMARRGQLGECEVDGPFAFDNAISKESAKIKGINSPVAGDADIIILPNIETGNVLYKSLMFLSNTKSAGVVVGSKVPVVLLSRADNEECKFYSIALASVCS
jgi:phosphate butyryltransferase